MSVLTVTSENFEEKVLQSEKPVLLDFWASWCGPCMMMFPIVDELAESDERFTVGKINVDEQGDLAMKFGIVSIPTLIVMKDGKLADQTVGLCQKEKLLSMLEGAL